MATIFYILGSIAILLNLCREFRRWRERRWVKDSLKPWAGLDFVPNVTNDGRRHIIYRRLIWCAVALGFALMIAIPMWTSSQ